MFNRKGSSWLMGLRCCLAVTLLGVGSGCDSALAPEHGRSMPAASRTRSAVAAPKFSDRVILRDVRNEKDRREMASDFRRALKTERPEIKRHLAASINLVESYDTATEAAETTQGQVSYGAAPPDDLGSVPEFTSYMAMSPGGSGSYSLAGTTYIQTPNAGAQIHHSMTYSVGSVSRTVEHSSGALVPIHSTWASISCGQPTTVQASLVGTLTFNGPGGTATSHATLESRSCVPDEVDTTEPYSPQGGDGMVPDATPDEYQFTWCVVRTTYDRNTGVILSSRVLYCY